MGRYTAKLNDTLDAIALRKYVLTLPRAEYLEYISEHSEFRSSDAQLHSDVELLTMRAVDESMGRDAALTWAHRRYWHAVDKRWAADNLAMATSRVEALGLTLLFNGAKYGAVLAVAYLALPPVYLAAFVPVFSVIVVALAVCGAVMRKVL